MKDELKADAAESDDILPALAIVGGRSWEVAAARYLGSLASKVNDVAANLQASDSGQQATSDELSKGIDVADQPRVGDLRVADRSAPDSIDGKHADYAFTVEQAEFIGAEFRTSVGSGFYYASDAQFRQAATEVPQYPGEYVLDVHGTESSVQLRDDDGEIQELDASEFAVVVRASQWNGEPVRLFSCETGKLEDGFAQELADELDVVVTAPTTDVTSSVRADGSNDRPIVTDVVMKLNEELGCWESQMVFPETGEWKQFAPRRKGV